MAPRENPQFMQKKIHTECYLSSICWLFNTRLTNVSTSWLDETIKKGTHYRKKNWKSHKRNEVVDCCWCVCEASDRPTDERNERNDQSEVAHQPQCTFVNSRLRTTYEYIHKSTERNSIFLIWFASFTSGSCSVLLRCIQNFDSRQHSQSARLPVVVSLHWPSTFTVYCWIDVFATCVVDTKYTVNNSMDFYSTVVWQWCVESELSIVQRNPSREQ